MPRHDPIMDEDAVRILKFRAMLRVMRRSELRPLAQVRIDQALSFVEKAARGKTCAAQEEVEAFMAFFSGLDMGKP